MSQKLWGIDHPATIGTFDIGSKVFKEISLPHHFSSKFSWIRVRLLGGCLCLIGSRYQKCCEVWMMMKDNNGVRASLTKFFAIDCTKGTGIANLDIRQLYKNGVI
ncbi:hypothetical protein MKX01_034049 [Papaver californicum]|nr:hypothetical protein MKX01_034049 [Papaver californicum]